MKLIQTIFSAFSKFFGFLKDKQLIDAGKSQQELKQRDKINENVDKVNDARNDADNRKRVRDKYQRK